MTNEKNLESYSVRIGSNIRETRNTAKLTQTELGSKIGKNLRTIQKYESGEIEPAFSTIMQIAECLDVSPSRLLGLQESFSTANELEQRASLFLNTALMQLNHYRNLWLQGGKDAEKHERKHWEALKKLKLETDMYNQIFLKETTILLKEKPTGGNEYVLAEE